MILDSAVLINGPLDAESYFCSKVKGINNNDDNKNVYESRKIDIDIILYDDLIIEEKNLTIPHPRYTQRSFVLVPLLEIDNKLVDPKSKIMIKELIGDISSEEILDKIKFPYSKA